MKYAATDAWVCREMYMRLKSTELKPLEPASIVLKKDVISVEVASVVSTEIK